MRRKLTDQQIADVFARYDDLFEDLANHIICPGCLEITPGPFYNLGDKYDSAEGCKACADKANS